MGIEGGGEATGIVVGTKGTCAPNDRSLFSLSPNDSILHTASPDENTKHTMSPDET